MDNLAESARNLSQKFPKNSYATIWDYCHKLSYAKRIMVSPARLDGLPSRGIIHGGYSPNCAAMLAITVYLLIAALPVGFISGIMARILIPISLWFWVDLNEEIEDQPSGALKLAFNSWRWAITVYCLLGAIAQLPLLQCAISKNLTALPLCRAWSEPPLLFKEYFHPNTTPQFLGFLGIASLIFYVVCLSYFVLVKLGKQGRSAIQQ